MNKNSLIFDSYCYKPSDSYKKQVSTSINNKLKIDFESDNNTKSESEESDLMYDDIENGNNIISDWNQLQNYHISYFKMPIIKSYGNKYL